MKAKTPEYPIRMHWSDEDEAWIAEVPALPGCVSHGDTPAEAAANIEEAMELWLESARRHGDKIPEPDFARSRLNEIGPLLNISELARRSGINRATLTTKLRRGTRFTPEEDKAILMALESV